jgi:hypothetical protein
MRSNNLMSIHNLKLIEDIHYIDIGIDSNTDLIRWVRSNTNIFRLDILAARAAASEQYYQHIQKGNTKTVFIRMKSVTFTIVSNESVQYQILEAIISHIADEFFGTYGEICCELLTGMTNLFDGFQSLVPEIIIKVLEDDIIWVKTRCKLCQTTHKVAIKKILVTECKNFPVSIVYIHHGHGLVLYIDANFKVRGAELVDITG